MDIQGTVRDLLQDKGDQIWTTHGTSTVYDAIGKMGTHNIGALVVLGLVSFVPQVTTVFL